MATKGAVTSKKKWPYDGPWPYTTIAIFPETRDSLKDVKLYLKQQRSASSVSYEEAVQYLLRLHAVAQSLAEASSDVE